jgi:hypothetical protein
MIIDPFAYLLMEADRHRHCGDFERYADLRFCALAFNFFKERAVSKETVIIKAQAARIDALTAAGATKDKTIADLEGQLDKTVAALDKVSKEPKKDDDDVATEALFDEQGNPLPTPPTDQATGAAPVQQQQ